MYGTSSLRRYESYCTCRAARTAGWTFLLYQLSLLTVSTSTSWSSPASTLSSSESARWKSSFSKKRPAEVGNRITGRPNLPNQRNSMSRTREGENQRTYSRYINSSFRCSWLPDSIRSLPRRFASNAQEKSRHPLRHGRHLPLGFDQRHQRQRGRSGRGGGGGDLVSEG